MFSKLFKRYTCRQCRDTHVVSIKQTIPKWELAPIERAELAVLGGYAYRVVEKPCPCQW